ncbi:MAG: Hpt domain-containing protein [bacterium]|nr:Hpt domain-containing protein [bacterium]
MNKEALIQAGIQYEEGVYRFGGTPQIYEKYLLKFFDQNDLPMLRQALEDEDYDSAFKIAHNLKGGAGNLSIAAYFDQICELVEALRAGVKDRSLLAMLQKAEALYDTAYCAVKEEFHGKEN